MKKKLLSLALVLAMALTLLPTMALAATSCDGTNPGDDGCTATTHVKGCPKLCNHTSATVGELASTLTVNHTAGSTYNCTEDTWIKTCVECNNCGKLFADNTGASELQKAACFVAAKTHAYNKQEGTGECTNSVTFGEATSATACTAGTCSHPAVGESTPKYSYDEDHKCLTCGKIKNGETAGSITHSYDSTSHKCTTCGKTDPDAPTPASIGSPSFTIDPSDATKGTLSWTYTPASDAQGEPTFTITKPTALSSATCAAAVKGTGNYTSAVTGIPADLADGTYKFTISDGTVSAEASYTKGGGGQVAKGTLSGGTVAYDAATKKVTFTWTVNAPAAARAAWELAAGEVTVTAWRVPAGFTGALTDEMKLNSGVDKSVANGTLTVVVTLDTALAADQAVSVKVESAKLTAAVNNQYEHHVTPTEQPSTPSTPSGTVPSASTVTSPATAQTAVNNVQSVGADKLAEQVGKELTDTSSNASTATIDKLEALDKAVQENARVSVGVEADKKAPSALNVKNISIVGAALNAKEVTTPQTIELQVSAPKVERTLGRTYRTPDAVQFSMTLTNVTNAKKLAVPVIVTIPLPSGITPSKAVVLHYASDDAASEVLKSTVSGRNISFLVTGFSDFVITEKVDRKTSSGSGTSSAKTPGAGVVSGPVTVVPTTPTGIFTDVPANHSFASQITWARDNGVMGGYSDGSFRPTNPTNRQQLWMVLARLNGAAPADMAAAREWAVNAGVSDGSNPDSTLSRQQLVTMLYRYAQSQDMSVEGAADLTTYPDNAAVASYAQEALAWAVGKGIVTGTSDGRLNPEGTATRGQFAVIMYRFSHQG